MVDEPADVQAPAARARAGRHLTHVTSAHAVRWPSGHMVAPDRSVTPATIGRPHPFRRVGEPGPGPSSVTSTRAQPGAARTRTVIMPPSPLALWAIPLVA